MVVRVSTRRRRSECGSRSPCAPLITTSVVIICAVAAPAVTILSPQSPNPAVSGSGEAARQPEGRSPAADGGAGARGCGCPFRDWCHGGCVQSEASCRTSGHAATLPLNSDPVGLSLRRLSGSSATRAGVATMTSVGPSPSHWEAQCKPGDTKIYFTGTAAKLEVPARNLKLPGAGDKSCLFLIFIINN